MGQRDVKSLLQTNDLFTLFPVGSVSTLYYIILRFDSFLHVELIIYLLKVVIKVLTIEILKSCTIRLVK